MNKIKTIRIESSYFGWGVLPDSEELHIQKITISNNGRVWLSYYGLASYSEKNPCLAQEYYKVSKATAESTMTLIEREFLSTNSCSVEVTDVPVWVMDITFDDLARVELSGPVFEGHRNISYKIRRLLGLKNLFLFNLPEPPTS